MVKTWLFDLADYPYDPDPYKFDAAAASELMHWYLDLWTQSEAMGFEGVFLSEHHFQGGALAPSPNLLLAALAARTKTLRLGVMGLIVPMYQPWRVAEEAAMLDHLSGGRLELGLVRGIGPLDLIRVGIDPKAIQPAFEEACDVIELALRETEFDFSGEHFSYAGLGVIPRPVQSRIPIWMTAQSGASAARAASHGHKLCTGRLPLPELVKVCDAYRDAASANDVADCADALGLRRNIIVAGSRAQAAEIADEALEKLITRYGGAKALNAPLIRSREDHIVGSPADVTDQIVEQCRVLGTGHFLTSVPATMARSDIEAGYRLLASHVIPTLREIDLVPVRSAQVA